MAEIPVERRRKSLWWLWLLLGALLLALLVWLLVRDDDREATVAPTPEQAMEFTPPHAPGAEPRLATGTITGLATIASAADPSALIGREVEVKSVRVTEMVGDRTFYVGEGDRRVFVVLNEQPMPGNGVEGRYDVNKGQVIDIRGRMTRVENGSLDGQRIEGLPAGQDVVLYAQSLTITQRP